MRVCHIGFNFFPGQGLTIFYELARHQASQGLEVTVIAPGRPGEPVIEYIDGVRVHRIPLRSIGRFSLDRLRFLARAASILRQKTVDVIHTYAFVGAGILPMISGRSRARWLYDCQTSAIKPPFLGLQNGLIRVESHPFDAIIVLSEGIRDIVFGPGACVEAVVPLGADFEHFRPRRPDSQLLLRHGIAESDCVFSYCGTLDHNRRMDKLLNAFAFVAGRENSAKLLIIGDGSARRTLQERARELDLQQRIIFTGFVPYSEVPAHLAISTVALAFISMDACFEHQPPTKTVEYLAQGLPVIATDTAGNRAFIRHDFNGFLSQDGADTYGQAMLDLMHDSDHRLRLAANARSSVRAFDWAEIVRTQLIPIYRKLMQGRGHSRG